MNRGYFGIGIENSKNKINYGTLFRSAKILGANFIFTVGKRFEIQTSDTIKSHRHMPLFEYDSFNDFYKNIPYNCKLIGIEMLTKAKTLKKYIHPERAIYLLGHESLGLSKQAIEKCHDFIKLPGEFSLNVSVAGSIIIYDRISKYENNN
jgi:tRNA (guanosine-2'-O-)-methyltransferase